MTAPAPATLAIFDCDGILVDSELLSNRLLSEALAAEGFDVSPDACRERFTGIALREAIAEIEAETGRRLPEGFEERTRAHDIEVFSRELRPVAGIAQALARIDLPKCVASSGAPEKIRHSLVVTGLLDFFDPHLYSAHQVARGKPAPDLFLFAAEQMGAAPSASVVIEDSEAGIAAARAAGMRVLGFAGASHAGPGYAERLAKAGADVVFDDMAELPDLLTVQVASSG